MLHKSLCFPEFLRLFDHRRRSPRFLMLSWTAKSSSAGWRERSAGGAFEYALWKKARTLRTSKRTCMYACMYTCIHTWVHTCMWTGTRLSSSCLLFWCPWLRALILFPSLVFLWPALMLLLSACLVISLSLSLFFTFLPVSLSSPSPQYGTESCARHSAYVSSSLNVSL